MRLVMSHWACGKGPPIGEPQASQQEYIAVLRISVSCDTGRAHAAG